MKQINSSGMAADLRTHPFDAPKTLKYSTIVNLQQIFQLREYHQTSSQHLRGVADLAILLPDSHKQFLQLIEDAEQGWITEETTGVSSTD